MSDAAIQSLLDEISLSCSHGSLSGRQCISRAFANVQAMLRRRGYGHIEACSTFEDMFDCIQRDQPVIRGAQCADKPDIVVIFHVDAKIGIKSLRALLDAFSNEGIVCIVSTEGPTTFTKKDAKDDVRPIQFLTFRQMFNDIVTNRMVPTHRKLSEDEARRVKERYNIQNSRQWPQLLLKDPIAVYYDFKKGDLIEITRRGQGAQEVYFYYRLVT